MSTNNKRAVITGLGIISPYGFGVDKFWNSLLEGKSGISTIENISPEGHTVHVAGEIKNFEKISTLDPKESKRMDRYTQFAMMAADDAMVDSGLEVEKLNPYRFGVIVGSAAGGFATFEKQHLVIIEKGPSKCSPFTVPMIIADMGAGRISMKYGAKGPNKAIVTACATSAHCIGDSFRIIQYGEADVIIAGGAEAVITRLGIGAFTAARTLSKRNNEPKKASRPYDADRDGFVMSEGAAVVIVEELEHAKVRGAKIYAEIAGYGQTGDAYDIVAPDPSGAGAAKAMEFAIRDAGLKPADIQYINSHGTSTGLGDIAESRAIAEVFGDLSVNENLKVSSTKSMHGHMLGATGAAETIVCVKVINEGIIPPTINLDNQDEHVANLNYIPHKAIKANVSCALTNSFGFGGHNASLVLKKYVG